MLFLMSKYDGGARGGTRTRTVLLPSGPKPGASTNFATRAKKYEAADFSVSRSELGQLLILACNQRWFALDSKPRCVHCR